MCNNTMTGGAEMTLHQFLWRAEHIFSEQELVSRHHRGVDRFTYVEYANRVRQLASALDQWGITTGDRVATFGWNHHWHHELYCAVPNIGAQLHMINILSPESHIEHIVDEAEDVLLFVDATLIDTLEQLQSTTAFNTVEQYVVMDSKVPDTTLSPITDHESFIADGDSTYSFPSVDETQPAGLCYTSGTTGEPKGVEYTHKMYWGHTMGQLTGTKSVGLDDTDTSMPVVPMFHASGWGRPFAALAAGANLVLPGPDPDPSDIVQLIEREEVTISSAVPAVWRGLLEYADNHRVDLSSLEYIFAGGTSIPQGLIKAYHEQFDTHIVTGFGMTETTPVAHWSQLTPATRNSSASEQIKVRAKSGIPLPGVQMKLIDETGAELPWDGESLGELLLKGPWVTTEYFNAPQQTQEQITEDGWLRTGDIARIDEHGYVEIVDRVDDLIKSGGEWISSVELEDRLMSHTKVREAAVIAVEHDYWDERPVAFVVASDEVTRGQELRDTLSAYITEEYPEWWAPDVIEFIDEIPKKATGKFSKQTLRSDYVDESIRRRLIKHAPGE